MGTVALGYYIEAGITESIYLTMLLLTIIQFILWWRATQGKLQKQHFIALVPSFIHSSASALIHVDYRMVFGIYDIRAITVLCWIISLILVFGGAMHVKKLLIFKIQDLESSSQNRLSMKYVVTHYSIFFVLSAASYFLALAYNRLYFLSINFFGFCIAVLWVFEAVYCARRLLLELALLNPGSNRADKYGFLILFFKKILRLLVGLFVFLVFLSVFLAAQGEAPYDMLFGVKDSSVFRLGGGNLFTISNVSTGMLFMYSWRAVVTEKESCILDIIQSCLLRKGSGGVQSMSQVDTQHTAPIAAPSNVVNGASANSVEQV
jgi:hypothetical protein